MGNYDPSKAHPLTAAQKGSFTDTGKYPYLKVRQEPCGCLYVDDMTPGYEQHHRFLCSGGIESYGPNGETVHVSTNKKHEYVADGLSTTIDGQHDVKVSGNQRIAIIGSHHLETAGNFYIGANGSMVISSNGSHVTSTTGGDIHTIANGHMISQVDGDTSQIVGGNTIHQVAGTVVYKANKDIVLNSLTSVTLQCGKSSLTLTPDHAYLVSPAININTADDNNIVMDQQSIVLTSPSTTINGQQFTDNATQTTINGTHVDDEAASTFIKKLSVGSYGSDSAAITLDAGTF
jgi:hypothetical protein